LRDGTKPNRNQEAAVLPPGHVKLGNILLASTAGARADCTGKLRDLRARFRASSAISRGSAHAHRERSMLAMVSTARSRFEFEPSKREGERRGCRFAQETPPPAAGLQVLAEEARPAPRAKDAKQVVIV